MRLLDAFPCLKLKVGLVLRAYVFSDGSNGNGLVWAMPRHLPCPEPDERVLRVGNEQGAGYGRIDFLPEAPKLPGALSCLMDAIDGDGTPFSFLSASIFAREAAEFGAVWHGCNWTTHDILGADSWTSGSSKRDRSTEFPTNLAHWTWLTVPPQDWEPVVEEDESSVRVRFFTFTALGQERILLHTDTFERGSYRFDVCQEEVAQGQGGYVF